MRARMARTAATVIMRVRRERRFHRSPRLSRLIGDGSMGRPGTGFRRTVAVLAASNAPLSRSPMPSKRRFVWLTDGLFAYSAGQCFA